MPSAIFLHFSNRQVVMEEGQTFEDGKRIADDLMAKLGILPEDLITSAYMDLLLKKKQNMAAKHTLNH